MNQRFLRFSLVGTVGFVVDVVVLYGLIALGLNLIIGRIGSFLVAATTTWALNRQYTFGDRPKTPGRRATARQWLHFVVVNAVGGSINVGIYAVLVTQLPLFTQWPAMAVAVGSIAGLAFNYTASRLWVF